MKRFFILFFLLLCYNYSFGCSCEYTKVKKAYKDADVVFSGEVVSFKEVIGIHKWKNKEGKIDSIKIVKHDYVFKIIKNFKGKDTVEFINLTTDPDEGSCGYVFEKGRKYLVYSYKTDVDIHSDWIDEVKKVPPYFTTNLCMRTNELSLVDKREIKKLYRYKRRFCKK